MDLSFCQSGNGFPLDKLVIKLTDAFERKASGELLKMILQLVLEILYRIFHSKQDTGKCGEERHLGLNGSFN